MKQSDLVTGKYYRKIAVYDARRLTNIGVVFGPIAPDGDNTGHYLGRILYNPNPRPGWNRFWTESFDEYEEVGEEEVTVYLLAQCQ